MSGDVGVVVFLLLMYAAPAVVGQAQRCVYMAEAIPREPRPEDIEEITWTGGWNDRPIIPGPDREEVCMDQYFPDQGIGTQVIYLQEEVEGHVPIAKLNYEGTATPELDIPLPSGLFHLLGPELRNDTGEWLLYVTQRQDYESPGMQQYLLGISIAEEPLKAFVSLLIANIDDNDPIIRSMDACQTPELGEAPRLTNCTYQVTDADGELSIRMMTFRIDSDRRDDEIFYIEPAFIPNEWSAMEMTIGLHSTLNFETSPLHIFQVTALDSVENSHTVSLMVRVQNVEHRMPRWMDIFAVQQFDEKTAMNFTVRAIDADLEIDKPIYYKLEADPEDPFFSIETIEGGYSGGIFFVDPIDRDELQREVFQLNLIAYKPSNTSLASPRPVVIIINDINDKRPEPLHKDYFISIMEETPTTLDFEEEFGFHDKDLGPHAQYSVELESVYPPNVHLAFTINPSVGYQRQTFILSTQNHSMLDYEDVPFQHIHLRVVATDLNDTKHVGVANVYIDLINWNDELPIFEQTTLTVQFNETEGEGFFVGRMQAHDRDIGDRVEHSLMGNAGDYLWINSSTGEIFVSRDDAFDYHRQNVLFVQVRADDTLMAPYHTATAQLTIELFDINNTPPSLRLPRGSPSVEENVPEGYEITRNITATDPDTTAYLRFEIDWETSYATKAGRDTPAVEFTNCVDIETIFPDPTTNGTAIGRVVVKEIRDNVTIDYEEFEILYITVRVWDDNTVYGVGYDEMTFAIIIIDMNDNAPIFANGSLEQNFRVREMSDRGINIGSVLATDIDGPLYNQVRYTITPRNDTPDHLVEIDFYTGQISVNTSGAIDADIPPRWHLYYTVLASDACYAEDIEDCPPDPTVQETEGNITIEILDTNNRTPYPDITMFNDTVYIFENATSGDFVTQLFAIDLDRDAIYNKVRYQINFDFNPLLPSLFAMDLDTGVLTVEYSANEVLDRDGDHPTHQIFFNLIDNFYFEGGGNRNQNSTEILVVLLDVNDNAPELPVGLSWTISENAEMGYRLDEIYAPDRDEPDTPNSAVGYAILDLSVTNRDIRAPPLFNMIQIANLTGELEVAMPLKGYWGTYSIHILAYDHGIPQQMSNETYEIEITPYNFHEPVFVFPETGTFVRLARERAAVNVMLALVNGDFLERISATDEDGLHAGVVTFEVVGEASQYFDVVNEGDNQGFLTLRQMFAEDTREFEVVIRATDGGTDPGPLWTETTINVVFVPTIGDPIFEEGSFTVAFFEHEGGLEEKFQLPHAVDPKNFGCDDDCFPIYYRIFNGNNDNHFALDEDTNEIYLLKELDRNVTASHTITVAASNTQAPIGNPLPGSTLIVNVVVREANPRPNFESDLYLAGLAVTDTIGRPLFTVHATHSDGAPVVYTIDHDSMVVDPTLEEVRPTAFVLNPTTGLMTLNMQPTTAMHGMFEFNVIATDPAGVTDKAGIRIYMISTINRVTFTFGNTVAEVQSRRDFIARTFSEGFNMLCIIDEILQGNENGVAQDNLAEVRAHFIDDNAPVNAEVIEALRSHTAVLNQIHRAFLPENLHLQDMVTEISPDNDVSQMVVYVLGGIAACLAFICVVLLIAFVVKTRELNRRLQALSMTKYGSVDSGLNRMITAAPGTNKYADEASNPVYNPTLKAPDFDALSDISGESDLIGVEDLAQFRSDYYPEEDTSTTDILNAQPVATHSNNFGFNASPFSSDFANSRQFRRI